MNKLKFKLAMVAMVMGVSGAFATLHKAPFSSHKWSRDNGTGVYTDITGQVNGTDYDCNTGTAVCTATYPAGQNPNSNAANPLSVETGIFSN